MARSYVTRDGDMLDLICTRAYGSAAGGILERVIEANRMTGLVDHGPHLPRGLSITLPDLPDRTVRAPTVKLWD